MKLHVEVSLDNKEIARLVINRVRKEVCRIIRQEFNNDPYIARAIKLKIQDMANKGKI